MKKLIFLASFAVFFAAAAVISLACPASPDTFEVIQNGIQVEIGIFGDEFFSWNETADGSLCVPDGDGNWMYALYDGVALVSTDIPVQLKPPAYAQSGEALAAELQDIEFGFPEDEMPALTESEKDGRTYSAGKTVTRWRQDMLVILIEYSDVKLRYDEDYWYDRFFNLDTSSVNDYYDEISGGRFSFAAAGGRVWRASFNDRGHPTPTYTENNYARIRKDITDALNSLDSSLDFSRYDSNGDHRIAADELHICVVFAGGEAAGGIRQNSIWAHAWQLADMPILDGVQVGLKYAAQGEIYNNAGDPLEIGVTCHELGHSLGLPDLYDYTSRSRGIGGYSLMSSGNWGARSGENSGTTPVYPDAYCMASLGFCDVATVSAGSAQSYRLNGELGNRNIVKIVSDADSDQYFLISNRTIKGYDEGMQKYGIYNGGALIFHVDESVIRAGGRINDNPLHKGVDVEEADGLSSLDTAGAYCSEAHFYKDGGAVEFTPESSPSSNFHTVTLTHVSGGGCGSSHPQEVETGINVTVSGVSGGEMTATVSRDGYLPNPEYLTFLNGAAKWAAVTGATHYIVHLYLEYVDATSLPVTEDLLGPIVVTEAEREAGCNLLDRFNLCGDYYFTVAASDGKNESETQPSQTLTLSEYTMSPFGGSTVKLRGFIQGGVLKAILDSFETDSTDAAVFVDSQSGGRSLNLDLLNSLTESDSGLPVQLLRLGPTLADSLGKLGDRLSLILPDTVISIADELLSGVMSVIFTSDGGVTVLNALKARLLGLPYDFMDYYRMILG